MLKQSLSPEGIQLVVASVALSRPKNEVKKLFLQVCGDCACLSGCQGAELEEWAWNADSQVPGPWEPREAPLSVPENR